jgi:hypothetical protein
MSAAAGGDQHGKAHRLARVASSASPCGMSRTGRGPRPCLRARSDGRAGTGAPRQAPNVICDGHSETHLLHAVVKGGHGHVVARRARAHGRLGGRCAVRVKGKRRGPVRHGREEGGRVRAALLSAEGYWWCTTKAVARGQRRTVTARPRAMERQPFHALAQWLQKPIWSQPRRNRQARVRQGRCNSCGSVIGPHVGQGAPTRAKLVWKHRNWSRGRLVM